MIRKATRPLLIMSILMTVVALVATACGGGGGPSDKQVAFQGDMRKLWEDHITWTRLAIESLVNGSPDTQATVNRLLQNQADIGNAIKPYYGNAAGDKLASLLHDHITIAAEVVTDAKAGDSAKLTDAQARWNSNADDIAALLSGANPTNWPLNVMQATMKEHLGLTTSEAVAYIKGDYSGSVAAYDQVHAHIIHMADTLSSGIIKQFPKMF